MRNWTEHGFSRLTAISDAGSTPAASTNLRIAKVVPPEPFGAGGPRDKPPFGVLAITAWRRVDQDAGIDPLS